MKINDTVFFTDNQVVRIETDNGNFYLTKGKKIFAMHPSNCMAEEVTGSLLKEVKTLVKNEKYHNDKEVKTWL